MATATLNLFPIQASSSSSSSSSSSPTSCSCRTTSRLSFYSNLTRSRTFPSLSFKLTKSRSNSLSSSPIVSAHKKLSESDLITVPSEANEISGTFPSDSGVYAVFDKNNDLQFIGVSRSIAASVLSHRNSLPELCSSVKIGVVNDPDRTTLTEAWKSWMEEHIAATGKIPPGNESGNGIWIKRRPQKKSDLRLTPGRNKQLTVSLEDLIDRLVKENKVVAFIKGSRSAPLCGFSQRVVGILESQGIDYESVDVLDEEHNFGLRETLKSYSNWPTFPQIFVNGELVGGCDILVAMQESGELATLVKK